MKTLKIMLFVLTAALIAAGCREDSESNKVTGNVRFLSVVKDEIATKSSIEVDDSAIITIGIHLYDNMGRLAGSYNFSGEGEISIDLPAGESYIVYALANVGEFTPPLLEIDMRVVSIEWPGLAGITSGGFPLAHTGTLTVAQGNNSYTMEFVRLVARYDLVIDRSNLEGNFEVTGVRLRNSAADVFPFSARAATATLDGDISTTSDLQRLNTGSAVSFYMYENLQGNLLPDNRDPWAKIPDNIPSAKNLCTFIEIEGRYIGGGVSAGLNSDNMTFRFYLGADNTSSFDIVRNTIQTLSFLPSDNSISTESWKVDPGIVVDNRSIGWDPPVLNIVAMEQDTACLVLSPAGLPVTLKGSEFFENGHLNYSREGERVIISSTSNVVSPMSATLTAGTLDMKKSSILQINVVPSVSVTDIIVTPSDTSLFYEKSVQLRATAVWSDGSTSDVTEICYWNNDRPDAALLSSSAVVTNIYSGNEDRVDVAITARYFGKSHTANIECYRNGYTSHSYELNVDPTSVTVTVGSSFQITAILTTKTFVNGEEMDCTTSDVTHTAQWITHHPDKATVSAGEVSVLTTGIAIIQASHSRESDFTYVNIIPQTAPTITSISISPTSATITANGSTSFIATATYSDGSMEDITSLCTWSSSDTDAATVSNGTATGCNTTYSIKTTTITATFSGMSATANLTVEGVTKSPTAISISASPSTIEWNGTSLLSATVTWSDGSVTTETDVTYTIVSGEEYVYNYQVEEGTLKGNNSESSDRNVIIRGTFSYGGTVLTDDVVVTIQGKEGVSASEIVLFMNRYTIAQGDSPCILSAMVTYSDGSTETFTSSEVTYSLEGENAFYANLIGNTVEAANNSDSYKPVMVKVSYTFGEVTVTDSRILNVRPKYPVEVQVTPSDNNFTSPSGVTLASGQSISFTSVAIHSDGSSTECTSSSLWTITVRHSDGGTRVISGNSVSYGQLYDEQEYTITGVTVTTSYTTDDGLKSTTATGTLSGLITLQ